MTLEVYVHNDRAAIQALVDQGFCPVECSIDGRSIVDGLEMDHHGELSHLEAVSVRAYRDHFGARAHDPRFVIAGSADADACFAVAALAGLLPHPSRAEALEGRSEALIARLSADLLELAQAIALIDTNPIGVDMTTLPFGPMIMMWDVLVGSGRNPLSPYLGVGLWERLTCARPKTLGPYLNASLEVEASRREEALRDLEERGIELEGVLVIRGSRVFGFEEWYARALEAGPYDASCGWLHPIVVSWQERHGSVTVGCPNTEVACQEFGPLGLKAVLPKLDPPGWGGREAVAGSPRGVRLTWEQVVEAVSVIAANRRG